MPDFDEKLLPSHCPNSDFIEKLCNLTGDRGMTQVLFVFRLDAVLLSRVPTDRKADLSQPLASFSGRSSKAGGGVNGRNPIKEYSSSEEESDEAAELLDRYDIEARQLEAAEVAKAARQSQQAEKQASKRRRDRRGLEGQGYALISSLCMAFIVLTCSSIV